MAKWAAEGKEIVLCVVTNGAAGSNDPSVERDWLIRTRESEQREAASVIGISEVVFLGYEDGYVEDSHELRRDMIREIRRFKPEVVIGLDPTTYYFAQRYVNHPDHRKVGEAFLAAVNPGATTVPLYRADLYDKGFEPHHLKACLLGFSANPDYFVDIKETIEIKIKALKAHASQMKNFDRLEENVKMMAGLIAGVSGQGMEFAEGFKSFLFDQAEPPPTD
jgi:LmbE family N-acetylglucosaminyl deacetylase